MRRTEGLDQARAFIEAHFSEPLTLEQMAAPAALSISRFATAFRERFGSSPYRYLCGLRIKRAQSLLLAGVPSIAVAAELGFFDQSHFGRHFKRICGVTPTMFVANALAKHGAPSKLVTAALVLGPTARFDAGPDTPAATTTAANKYARNAARPIDGAASNASLHAACDSPMRDSIC
jgi:AraC-like DNA-binding protein